MKPPSSLTCRISRAAYWLQKLGKDNSHDEIFFIFSVGALIWLIGCIIALFLFYRLTVMVVALFGLGVILLLGAAISELVIMHQHKVQEQKEDDYTKHKYYVDAVRRELGVLDLF